MAGATVTMSTQSQQNPLSANTTGSDSSSFQMPNRFSQSTTSMPQTDSTRPGTPHATSSQTFHRSYQFRPRFPPNKGQDDVSGGLLYDGKRMRKAIHRKTVDYNPSVLNYIQVIIVLHTTSLNVPKFNSLACQLLLVNQHTTGTISHRTLLTGERVSEHLCKCLVCSYPDHKLHGIISEFIIVQVRIRIIIRCCVSRYELSCFIICLDLMSFCQTLSLSLLCLFYCFSLLFCTISSIPPSPITHNFPLAFVSYDKKKNMMFVKLLCVCIYDEIFIIVMFYFSLH